MPGSRSAHDRTMLEMALVGYEVERQKIDEKISNLRSQLGVRAPARKSAARRARGSKTAGKRSPLSDAARKRISAAQKRRWAEHRRKAAQESKAAAKASTS